LANLGEYNADKYKVDVYKLCLVLLSS